MTRYNVNGRIVDKAVLPDFLDDSAFAELTDSFEEEFNEANLPADVLYYYGGEDEYHRVKREWIAEKIEYDPRFLKGLGVVLVSESKSVRGKAPMKSASVKGKSKAPAKKSTAKGRR